MSVLSPEQQAVFASQKVVRIGDEAPDFKAQTQLGDFHFHSYIDGHWAILMSHPAYNTPVCTTELGRLAQLKDEFAKRGVKVAALSVDSVDHNQTWIKDINELSHASVDYPVVCDVDRKVSVLYGMLDQTKVNEAGLPLTVRSVYIVGPDKKVKLIITYPASTGRNFDEILRVIDSLKLTSDFKVATPADWKKGDRAIIIPALSDADAAKLFPNGFDKVKPYLRWVPDPSVAK